MDIKNQLTPIYSSMRGKKVLMIALPLLAIILSVVALVYFKVISNPLQKVTLFNNLPKVSTKKEYKNPFDKKTQYVNPFDNYKNPFVVAK